MTGKKRNRKKDRTTKERDRKTKVVKQTKTLKKKQLKNTAVHCSCQVLCASSNKTIFNYIQNIPEDGM